MTREIVLGVDFGTSYTSAGALIDGRIELVVDNGDPMIPSVVHIPERGPAVVGRVALNRLPSHPSATVTSVKRLMGSELGDSSELRRLAPTVPYRITSSAAGGIVLKLRNQDWAVEQIAAAILDRVRNLAEQRFGAQVRRIVVTASAVASPGYHVSLRKAARLAHLEILEIIAEPIAGALALGMHAHAEPRRVLVCDFGGGTFDVTAMLQAGTKFRALAIGGDPFLGGDDLDEAMVQALAGLIYTRARFDLLRDNVRRQTLLLRCESAKRSLSTALEARLNMREAYIEDGASRDVNVLVDRTWVQPLWDPLFKRALTAVDDTMKRAGWTDDQVDQVALIGGTSLVPRFQELLRGRFAHVEITATDLANVAVAMGATLLTARHGPARNDGPELEQAASM
ncbi:MAG: Hsp70 family protein [Deltaproteobacteria bacterium]|nr:Hsp70 family protein [Deltaproteobacteria bacterium]